MLGQLTAGLTGRVEINSAVSGLKICSTGRVHFRCSQSNRHGTTNCAYGPLTDDFGEVVSTLRLEIKVAVDAPQSPYGVVKSAVERGAHVLLDVAWLKVVKDVGDFEAA